MEKQNMTEYKRLNELSRKERRELNRIVRRQRRMKAPCKDCEKRHFNCHGTCPAYQTFRLELDKRCEERAMKAVSTPEICRKVVKQIWKGMKK